jgi:hypothetical protein
MQRKNRLIENQIATFLRRKSSVGGGMIWRPTVADKLSRRWVALLEVESEKGNMGILGTTRLLFIFLTKPFSSKFPSIFALETIFQHGQYLPSSEGNPVSKVAFRALERIPFSAIKIPHRPKRIYLSGCYVLTLRTLTFR